MKDNPIRSEEELRLHALDHELSVLRSRHETLGTAYRDACTELMRLREQVESYRARLHAVSILCACAESA
jgi:chromosome segregation ATPase